MKNVQPASSGSGQDKRQKSQMAVRQTPVRYQVRRERSFTINMVRHWSRHCERRWPEMISLSSAGCSPEQLDVSHAASRELDNGYLQKSLLTHRIL